MSIHEEVVFRAEFEGYKLPRDQKGELGSDPIGPFKVEVFNHGTNSKSFMGRLPPANTPAIRRPHLPHTEGSSRYRGWQFQAANLTMERAETLHPTTGKPAMTIEDQLLLSDFDRLREELRLIGEGALFSEGEEDEVYDCSDQVRRCERMLQELRAAVTARLAL